MLVVVAVSASCTETIYVECEAGSPGCVHPVAEVSVVSPVDSVVVVGWTAQLSAAATNPRGEPIADASFVWTSTNPATLIVDATGLIAARQKGSAEVVATADGVSGALLMRAVEADLGAVGSALADPLVASLLVSLDPATAAALTALLSDCSGNVAVGNVLALEACLDEGLSATAASGKDTALLDVLKLILGDARGRLQLEG